MLLTLSISAKRKKYQVLFFKVSQNWLDVFLIDCLPLWCLLVFVWFLSCWTCACWTFVALSFLTASSLLQPCFISPRWSWWKTFQVTDQIIDFFSSASRSVSLTSCFSLVSPPSSEEGGGGGVCEVDGAVRHGTAGVGWAAYEDVCRNPCRWHAQHPAPRPLPDMAGEHN